MKHLKRLGIGLIIAIIIFWPYLFWWNNVAQAEMVGAFWWVGIIATSAAYGAGALAQKIIRRASRG